MYIADFGFFTNEWSNDPTLAVMIEGNIVISDSISFWSS
jgi:hypothetical protein